MTTCKQRTMKEMEKHKVISGFFKDFYNSEAFDRFAHLFILYFAARLQRDWIQRQQQDKTKRHYGLDLAMHAVSAKLEELEHEQNLVLSEISPVYMEIIMKYSRYQQEQQDRCGLCSASIKRIPPCSGWGGRVLQGAGWRGTERRAQRRTASVRAQNQHPLGASSPGALSLPLACPHVEPESKTCMDPSPVQTPASRPIQRASFAKRCRGGSTCRVAYPRRL